MASRSVLRVSLLTSASVAMPLLLIVIPLSDWLMTLYGGTFVARGRVLALTAATAGLLAIQTPVGSLIAAHGRMWLGTLMNTGWALVLLVAGRTLVGLNCGADGAAAAFVIAYSCHALWTFWFAAQLLREPPL